MTVLVKYFRVLVTGGQAGLCCLILLLLPAAVPALSVTSSYREPPLHAVAEACDLEKVKLGLALLANRGPEPAVDSRDDLGETALMAAARGGCLEVVAFLVEAGAAVEARSYDGWTALHQAAAQRHAEVVRYLLANGANANLTTSTGKTALLEAIDEPLWQKGQEGDGEATIQALLQYGADVNLPGEFGQTPLIKAALRGKVGLVQRLLNKGANVKAMDEQGRTALGIARAGENREIENLLREAEAK